MVRFSSPLLLIFITIDFFWTVGWELLFTEKIIYSSVVSLVSCHIMKPAQIIFVTVRSKNICNLFHLIFLNLLKPSGSMMHQQFNIQQLYILPVLYLCVLYLSENKQRLVPLTA
jgi:hypothetical protein